MAKAVIKNILISDIHIPNPRHRNRLIAEEIKENIQNVGLKRPITVIVNKKPINGKKYHLVSGQGRLEAFIASGETEIAAVISNMSEENAYIASLVENIARKQYTSLELLQSIRYLKSQGHDSAAIAKKTNLKKEYIHGITNLLDNGEDRLVHAVETGKLPLTLALRISTENDVEVLKTLEEVYDKDIKGEKFLAVKSIIDRRKQLGKGFKSVGGKKKVTADDMIALYETEIKNKKMTVAKAERVRGILDFVLAALRDLWKDEHFTNQLKAENIRERPKKLRDLMGMKG